MDIPNRILSADIAHKSFRTHGLTWRGSFELIRRVLPSHLSVQQVLRDGVFNADLHPGNFLLLPDGRLGLIDYGQVKRITPTERRQLAELIIAVADRDAPRAVRIPTFHGTIYHGGV